jgi:hypothetical protein
MRFYSVSLLLMLLVSPIFSFEYDSREDFNKDLKKVVTMLDKLDMPDKANKKLDEVIEDDPTIALAHFIKGKYLFERDSGSKKSFERAILLDETLQPWIFEIIVGSIKEKKYSNRWLAKYSTLAPLLNDEQFTDVYKSLNKQWAPEAIVIAKEGGFFNSTTIPVFVTCQSMINEGEGKLKRFKPSFEMFTESIIEMLGAMKDNATHSTIQNLIRKSNARVLHFDSQRTFNGELFKTLMTEESIKKMGAIREGMKKNFGEVEVAYLQDVRFIWNEGFGDNKKLTISNVGSGYYADADIKEGAKSVFATFYPKFTGKQNDIRLDKLSVTSSLFTRRGEHFYVLIATGIEKSLFGMKSLKFQAYCLPKSSKAFEVFIHEDESFTTKMVKSTWRKMENNR